MRKIIAIIAVAAAAGMWSCAGGNVKQEESKPGHTDREAIETILSRKSVRNYVAGKAVEQEKVELLMRVGMAAPSGMDKRPWELVVVNEREKLDRMADALPYAQMLKGAPMAIVVCGSPEKSSYWYVDCSAVSQNILLAAEALGLGAVWTATYPYEDRMLAVETELGIPEGISSLCVIPVGYPEGDTQPKDKFDETKIHYNQW